MNIVLTGFMGTGKTVIGKAVAGGLGWPYADTDELVEKKAGMKIAAIFESLGEEHFRDLEAAIVAKVSALNNHVIGTGGGAVLRRENLDELEKNGFIVNLTASPAVIYGRVKADDTRPLLKKPDPMKEIKRLMEERKPLYARCDFSVDTDSSDIAGITEQIIHRFNEARIS